MAASKQRRRSVDAEPPCAPIWYRSTQPTSSPCGKRPLRGHRPLSEGEKMLRTLFLLTILAGALTDTAMAQAPDAGCALPSDPKGIPAAIDAAITGPADKDRAC